MSKLEATHICAHHLFKILTRRKHEKEKYKKESDNL